MNNAVGEASVRSLPWLLFDRRSLTCSRLIPKLNKPGALVGVAERSSIPVSATAVPSGRKPVCSRTEVRLREDPRGESACPGDLGSCQALVQGRWTYLGGPSTSIPREAEKANRQVLSEAWAQSSPPAFRSTLSGIYHKEET